jgi:hypothetical protein
MQYFNYFIMENNGTKIHGKHEFQYGMHLRYDQLTYMPQQQRVAGNVSFVSSSTGLLRSTDGGVTYGPDKPTYKDVADSGTTVYVKVVRAGTPEVIRSAQVIITPAELEITAAHDPIMYGDDAPAAFTLSYDGFKGTDTESVLSVSPVLTCDYDRGDNAGPYTITVDVTSVTAANYTIIQKPGTDMSESISKTAVADGATIVMLRPLEYSLEDVFLELTERAAKEEGKTI